MYKLVVLDIDGTLIKSNRRITRRTKRTIKSVLDLGVHVVICTGRNRRMAKLVVDKLYTKLPYCCVGGTEIFDADNQEIFSANLDLEDIVNILKIVNEEECFIQLTRQDGYIKYLNSDTAKKYEVFATNSIKGFISHKYLGMRYINTLEDFFTDKYHKSNEVIVGGPDKTLIKIKNKLEEKFKHIQVRDDLWDNYIFVSRKNISKANTIDVLCNHYNIDKSEVIAIGDDLNDIDMLKRVGLGIAMGNALESVKKSAVDITYTNDMDGVAHALEHYIINKKTEKINYTG